MRNVVLYYLKSMQRHLVVVFVACYVIMIYFGVATDYWLSSWTNDERQSNDEFNIQQRIYRMNIYAAFSVGYSKYLKEKV